MAANVGLGSKESQTLHLTSASGILGGRIRGWRSEQLLLLRLEDGKLSLRVYEPQFDQRYEDVESKREFYHILFSLKNLKFYFEKEEGKSLS